MERKIGGIFEFKGSKYNDSVKLMVIESDTCEGCYFQLPVYDHCSTKQIYEETGPCVSERTDGKYVIFAKIEE